MPICRFAGSFGLSSTRSRMRYHSTRKQTTLCWSMFGFQVASKDLLLHLRSCDLDNPPLGGKVLTSQGIDSDNLRTQTDPWNCFGCTAE
jgi:hypothetical protein